MGKIGHIIDIGLVKDKGFKCVNALKNIDKFDDKL
jgi:hypothetical protein